MQQKHNGPLPSTITFSLMPLVSIMRILRCFMGASLMAFVGSRRSLVTPIGGGGVRDLAGRGGRQVAAQKIELIGERGADVRDSV